MFAVVLASVLLTATGAPPRRVVLVEISEALGGWPGAEARVRAELEALDVELVAHVATAASLVDLPGLLEDLAVGEKAFAAIALVRGRSKGLHIWLDDRLTGKALLRRLPASAFTGNSGPSDVALKVVELLQASFLELALSAPTQPLPGPVVRLREKTPLEAPPASVAPESSLQLTAAALGSAGLFSSVAPQLELGARWSRQGLLLGGAVGVWWPYTASGEEGRASIVLASARALGGFGVALSSWRVGLAAMVGGLYIDALPLEANGGRTKTASAGLVAMLGARVTVERRIGWLLLGAVVEANVLIPGVEVFLGERLAARAGPAVVSAGVSIGWSSAP